MPFIRKKLSNGNMYYSLVETRRVDGKVRQTVILSLGRCASLDEAASCYRWWAAQYRQNSLIRGSGRRLFGPTVNGQYRWLVVGREAERRASKLQAKLDLLSQWQEVVSKREACGVKT